MGIRTLVETWGPITTVGELIEQVNEIGDVDPETPLLCFCGSAVILQLQEDEETKELTLEIDTPLTDNRRGE